MKQQSTSALLLYKGEKFYNVGSTMAKILGISAALLFLILLIGFMGWGVYSPLYILSVHSGYAFVDFLIRLSYLGLSVGLLGVPFYFIGLHFMGLGQIAYNTESLCENHTSNNDLPEL